MLLPWPESAFWPLLLFLEKIFSWIHAPQPNNRYTPLVSPWCLARCSISGFLGYLICREKLDHFPRFFSETGIFFWKSSVVKNLCSFWCLLFLSMVKLTLYSVWGPLFLLFWKLGKWILTVYCVPTPVSCTYTSLSTSDFKLLAPSSDFGPASLELAFLLWSFYPDSGIISRIWPWSAVLTLF